MNRYYIRFCFPVSLIMVLLLTSIPGSLFSQSMNVRLSEKQYVSKKWDNTNGLPVNTIFRLTKDQSGYLWAATEEGLVRFDGVNFKIFNQDNVPGLVSTMFYDLAESTQGGIWAANANTIVHANKKNIRVYDARSEVEGSWINSISEDHSGNVLAGTLDGNLLLLKNGNIQQIPSWKEHESGTIIMFEKISDGVLIGAENGLYKYVSETEPIVEIPEYSGMEVRAALEASNGTLWVGTRTRGLFHQTNEAVIVVDESNGLAHNQVNTLQLTNDGHIWAGFSKGGVQMITKDEIVSLREIEFGYNEVNDIYISDTGTVWITAVGHGIIQMLPADIRMLRAEDGLSNDITLAIYQDREGVIWTGTAGAGVNRISDEEITHITPEDGLQHGVILGIYGADGYIFLGTGNGLHRIDPETNEIDRHFTTEDGLADNIVQSVYQDSGGRIWVTSRSGGIHRLINHRELKRLTLPEQFEDAEFISILEDSHGDMWFSTTSTGILKLDKEDNATGYSVHHGPSSEMVLSLYEDPEGSIWAGTNEGLLVLKGDEFTLFNRSDGLQFNGIFRMIEDDFGYLWASGNFGIQRMRVEDLLALKNDETGEMKLSVRLFDTSDGMANHEANGGIFPAGWKMENGELWFPTMQGIARINPETFTDANTSVNVIIESLIFGDQEFSGADEISVPPGVNNLSINYGSFDFKKPHTINYSFRLSDLNEDWRQAGNRNTAFFTNLNPGNHTFEVKAEQFGVESEIASISFFVEPFFYQTAFFRVLVVLGLFFTGYFVHLYYSKLQMGKKLKKQVDNQTRELIERNEKLKTVMNDIEQQNRVLKEISWVQSHELRGPLSRILGLIDVLKDYERYKSIKKDKAELMYEIYNAALELDVMIRRINSEIEEIEQPEE